MVNATAKYVRVSPRKAGDVARRSSAARRSPRPRPSCAQPRAAAKLVGKVLDSAVANAENNHNLDADDLYVVQAYVDGGPTSSGSSRGRWAALAGSASAPATSP